METAQPPLLTPMVSRRRHVVTWKLLFIAALVLILQLPLGLINRLRQERAGTRESPHSRHVALLPTPAGGSQMMPPGQPAYNPARAAAEGYRMVERALKHSMLVLTLVFTAFFLFETLAGLRLHAVHYGLVGAALSLFYLALLALGEVLPPEPAYVGAALASSLLIVSYCASILRSYARAGLIAALLAAEYGVLYIVLRMEDYALLAGTASLFVVLAALMYFTRHVDWFDQETGQAVQP